MRAKNKKKKKQERSIGPDHNAGLQQKNIIPFEDEVSARFQEKENISIRTI